MINKIRIVLATLAGVALMFVAAPSPALAVVDCNAKNLNTQQAIQCGVNGARGTSNTQDPTTATKDVNGLITRVLNLISVVAGIIAVVMVVFGGLRFITSGGSEEKVKSAKKTLTYAVIGLVIVALAQVIVQFVLKKATQAPPPTTTSSFNIS